LADLNGRIPTASLVQLVNFRPIQTGAGGLARADVALQFALMAAAFERDLGMKLYVSEGYRDYPRQKFLRGEYLAGRGALAAIEGTSNHGFAISLDLGSTVGTKTSRAYAWMKAHAAAYGFVNDVASEGWHWTFKLKPTITPAPAAASAPAFPLPRGSYFGPRSGPAKSVSGYVSHRADLKRWQQRMKDRGWTISVDGLYGKTTASVAKAFQRQKGLSPDGLIGASTWAAAWTSPVT
jgi:hypothetical protein